MTDKVFLVVEDEQKLRESICRVLRKHGVQVVTASNLTEAEAALSAGPVHAVLVDLDLGESDLFDGIAVLSAAQRIAPGALRVLASGLRSGRAAEALNAGLAERFLLKPFGVSVLAEVVSEVGGRG